MNNHWANQYAKQRYADLSADARGGQLLRMTELDKGHAVSKPRTSVFSRLRAWTRVLIGRRVGQPQSSNGR